MTLKKLDEMSIDVSLKEKIEKLCYIGIAKNNLSTGGMSTFVKYSRVGILIRQYMNTVMAVKMEERRNS